MELNESTRRKIDNLPLAMRYAADFLLSMVDKIINGDCDEDEVKSAIGTIHQNASGRYGNEDLVNYDQVCKLLGFQVTNRVGLKRLLNKNNIHEVVINNMKCGFRRSKIMALRDKIEDDIAQREQKAKNKLMREKINNHKKQSLYDALLKK